MDYTKLIALAENKAKHATDSIKKTKIKTGGPDPKAIEKFLVEKRLKEIREEEEKRAKLGKLLSLRKQNSKSNKKAKLMANRTKDNDYSKIVLTDREIQNKERIDAELKKKGIDDKLGRMKERIELDHELEDLPIKRKRKTHQTVVEETNYNYNYDKTKNNNRDKTTKKLETQQIKPQQSKIQSKSNFKPPSFEELLRMAEQQKAKKKTLEEEIQEELSIKKPKNEKDDLKKREELYQKSLISWRKKKVNNVEPIQPSSSRYDTYEKNNHNDQTISSSSSVQSNSKRPILPDMKKERSAFAPPPISRRDDLPPISQVIKRKSKEPTESSRDNNGIEKILFDSNGKGNLASKIANLSKEELLELANAVKVAKKEKKARNDEHSPRDSHDEYRPSDYRSNKASSSYRSSSEPVYVPTKIKNQQEEYCPVNNYRSQTGKQSAQFREDRSNNKLFDIDSLTPDEIEKIRIERMRKQSRSEAAICEQSSRREPTKSNKHKSSPPSSFDRASKLDRPSSSRTGHSDRREDYPTQRRDYPPASSRGFLPPIGKNYRRGDYDTSYNDYDDYEDEEDDMSDFIDDGNDFGTQEDLSRAIEELFPKYKKRKYQILGDDSDIEESSYAQQMREEQYSSRVGLLEDLEEERREQEEKKRRRRKGIASSDEEE